MDNKVPTVDLLFAFANFRNAFYGNNPDALCDICPVRKACDIIHDKDAGNICELIDTMLIELQEEADKEV